MTHTPEPWSEFDCRADGLEYGKNNERIYSVSLYENDYNRARACVNACAGISNDDLEDHGTGGLKHWMDDADETLKAVCVALDDVEYLGRCEQGIYVLKQQRDELLALTAEMMKMITAIALDKDEPYHRIEYAKELAAMAEAIAKERGQQ